MTLKFNIFDEDLVVIKEKGLWHNYPKKSKFEEKETFISLVSSSEEVVRCRFFYDFDTRMILIN